jgi:hypothetical protein
LLPAGNRQIAHLNNVSCGKISFQSIVVIIAVAMPPKSGIKKKVVTTEEAPESTVDPAASKGKGSKKAKLASAANVSLSVHKPVEVGALDSGGQSAPSSVEVIAVVPTGSPSVDAPVAAAAEAGTVSTLTKEVFVYNADTAAVVTFANLIMLTCIGDDHVGSIYYPDVNHHFVNRREVATKKESTLSLVEIFSGDGSAVDLQVRGEILRGVELVFFSASTIAAGSPARSVSLRNIESGKAAESSKSCVVFKTDLLVFTLLSYSIHLTVIYDVSTLNLVHGVLLQPSSAMMELLTVDISSIAGLLSFGRSLGMDTQLAAYDQPLLAESVHYNELFSVVHMFYQKYAGAVFVGIEEGGHRTYAAKSCILNLLSEPAVESLLVANLSIVAIATDLSIDGLKQRSDRICRAKMSHVGRSVGDQLFDIVNAVKGIECMDMLSGVENLSANKYSALSQKFYQWYRSMCKDVVSFIEDDKFAAGLRSNLAEHIRVNWKKYSSLVAGDESAIDSVQKLKLVMDAVHLAIPKRSKLSWFPLSDDSKLVRAIPTDLRAIMDFVVYFVGSGLLNSNHAIRLFFTDVSQVKFLFEQVLAIVNASEDIPSKALTQFHRLLSVFRSLWLSIADRINTSESELVSCSSMKDDIESLSELVIGKLLPFDLILAHCSISKIGELRQLVDARSVAAASAAAAASSGGSDTAPVSNKPIVFSISVSSINPPKKKATFKCEQVACAAAKQYLLLLKHHVDGALEATELNPSTALDNVNALSANFMSDLESFGSLATESSIASTGSGGELARADTGDDDDADASVSEEII